MDKEKNKDSINMNELPKNNDQVVDIDMSVGDFTPDGCRYESVDDLTEKAILNLERTMIRSSYEYKNYSNYLKNELDLTRGKTKTSKDNMILLIICSVYQLFSVIT